MKRHSSISTLFVRYLLLIFLCAVPTLLHAFQTGFYDSFIDGDFTQNPAWTGADSLFTVAERNGNPLLQLQGSDDNDGDAYLAAPSGNAYGSWEFFVRLDGFSPSGSNFAYVYLISDQQALDGNLNGYAVRLGEGGSGDRVKLIRIDNGNEAATLITGNLDISGGGDIRVRVERDNSGNFTLYEADGYHRALNTAGNATDNIHTASTYFGVRAQFSSTRADRFYFDLAITFQALSITQISADQIDLTFSAAPDPSSVTASDFSVDNGVGNPESVSFPADSISRLTFSNPLVSQTYQISVSGLEGASGQTFESPQTLSFDIFDSFSAGDLILNEFMFDPPSGLPEYVELRNVTGKRLNIANFEIRDDNQTVRTISSEQTIVEPDDYLVISTDTTALRAQFGAQNYLLMSDLPSLNNSGDAVRLIDNEGVTVDSLSYTADWGGNDVAVERRDPEAPTEAIENWGDSPDPDGGTPGEANQVAQDTDPPKLTGLFIPSETAIRLSFSERISTATAQNSSNFALDNGISITGATQIAADSVQLALDSPLQSGLPYQLTVTGLEDIFGNQIAVSDTSFIYYITEQAEPGDLAINEFAYNPPSQFGEFIELWNHSDKALDLRNWSVTDETGTLATLTDSKFVLPPDSFIVLTADNDFETSFPTARILRIASLPSLNNDQDDIVIKRADGVTIDSLRYFDEWGGDDVALERRSETVSATLQANWGDSPATAGATAGSANEILPDTEPPALSEVAIQSNTAITLRFTEAFDQQSVGGTSNFTIDQGAEIESVTVEDVDRLLITLNPGMAGGTQYTLTVNAIEDLFGNSASNLSSSFTYFNVVTPDSGSVFITEFMFDPPDGLSEYIEIQNSGENAIDLNNWTLNDAAGDPAVVTFGQFIVPAGAYAVLAPDSTLLETFPGIRLLAMGNRFSSLNNGGDEIILRKPDNTRIDSLRFSSSWGGEGVSLERRSTNLSAVFQANWGDSPAADSGTPGSANQIPPDTDPPQLSALRAVTNSALELVFSEPIADDVTTSNITLAPALEITSLNRDRQTVTINLASSLTNGTNYTASVTNVADLFGNVLSSASVSLRYFDPVPVDSGDVLISEFMYDPAESFSEFIELSNRTNQPYSMVGWTLNDNTGRRRDITSRDFIIPPGEFVILAPDSTLAASFPDITILTIGGAFPSLNNSSDAIVVRDSAGTLLDSLSYTSDWGGDNVSLERRDLSVSASFRANWGDSPSSNLATPGAENQIAPDLQPPRIASVTVTDRTAFVIAFDESLGESVPINALNITPERNISGATTIADELSVTLDQALESGVPYELTISSVTDIFGNTSSSLTAEIIYFETGSPNPGDLIINEFSYDPPTGQSEFIELFNPSDTAFDLAALLMNDGAGSPVAIAEQQTILPSGAYLALVPDSTLPEANSEGRFLVVGSRFQALNNGGDAIVLLDTTGTQLDSLFYLPDWGGQDGTLERRDPSVAAIYRENWGSSPVSAGGTPGLANQIAPDQTPPELLSAEAFTPTLIDLSFSETLNPENAISADQITIEPSLPIQLVMMQGEEVRISIGQQLETDIRYEVTISNAEDLFGNRSASLNETFEFYRFEQPRSGDVVINEILYRKATGSDVEFIELFNRTERDIDLSGWLINDSGGNPSDLESDNLTKKSLPALSSSTIPLGGGDYLVLTNDAEFASRLTNGLVVSGFPSLNDDGDAVVLKDRNGVTVDSLFYQSSWGGDRSGFSVERRDPFAPSNDPSNWQTSQSPDGFSAGSQNSAFQPDQTPPEARFATLLPPNRLEVRFSEFVDSTAELRFQTNGATLEIEAWQRDEADRFVLEISDGTPGTELQIENLQDFRGNRSEQVSIAIARPLRPGDVVFNEIMYDPITADEQGDPEQAEYLELYNRTDEAISLEGFFIYEGFDEDGERDGVLEPVTSEAAFIPSGGYYLIYADDEPTFQESAFAEFFDIGGFPFVSRVDRGSLSLTNSGQTVLLADSTGTTIDSVAYSDTWHNPNLPDTKGISLERKSPQADGNDGNNWGSSATATDPRGGTPGAENSLFTGDITIASENSMVLEPNPFSPNGDGIDDNLTISYTLAESDYLLRIRIFDRYGRHIRTLVDGVDAGISGTEVWDGLDDSGNRNRIGYYIIYFEAFNSASGANVTLKKTVVLARRL